ncbi:hypothetical protein GCM10022244_05280 [Streptomyces gulbargensis]|uniref:Uncharacterized protein n=1 Tax=Streptomyces gulbargensis TaxID=364901 RepID=A0ABP7LEA1_9ACTN
MKTEKIRHFTFGGFGYRCRIIDNAAGVTEPIVVVGGAFQDMYANQRLEALWAKSATVISVDLPGSGSADVLPSSFGFDFLTGALVDLLDRLGVSRANVFAASYAVPIAYGLAQRYPERVARLALAGAALVYPPAQRAALQAMVDALSAGDVDAYVRMSTAALLSPGERDICKRGVVSRALARTMASVTDADILRHLASTQRVLDCKGFYTDGIRDVPALVFTGEHDSLTCPGLGREVAATIEGSLFALLRRADHLFHLERPAEVSDLINRFFTDQRLDHLPYLTDLERHPTPARVPPQPVSGPTAPAQPARAGHEASVKRDPGPQKADSGVVTYVQSILDTLARCPDKPVVIGPGDQQVTGRELRDSVHQLARELAARGIGRGHTVSLLTGNTPQALIARYAANLAGARVTPLYEGLSTGVLAHLVDTVETTLLLVDPTRYADLEELRPRLRVAMVATLDPDRHTDDVLAAAARQPAAPFAVPVGDDDDWCIRHTGGTTSGMPKSLQMRHGPYRRGLEHLCTLTDAPPRYLACTPLSHVAGLCADLALLQGGAVVLQTSFDPGQALAAIERERITRLWLLPPLLHQLLDHPALPTTDTSSIQRITYGGSPASATRLRQTEKVFGQVLHSWYGQNETLGLTEVHPKEHDVIGRHGQITVGRALPGVELSIRDPHGNILPAGSEGEIHARADTMMSGYWKQPELTARVLNDGWVRTGDLGYLDDDGYLFLIDRSQDTITVPDGHIYPSEIETVLTAHPAVAQCAVFGVEHGRGAERVHAAVVLTDGHRAGSAELRAFVTANKGSHHAPYAFHFMEALPLTSIGKPDKQALRRAFERPQ